MKDCIQKFLNSNNSKFNEYFNCYCLITRIKGKTVEYSRKNPFKIIFNDESITFIGINTSGPCEYHFEYMHINNCSVENNRLKLSVRDFYFLDTNFEFEFLFVFNKYILDAFSVKKEDLEAVVEKKVFVDYSKSWFDERKESQGILKRVGDLRISIEEENKSKQEVEIFDINFFFVKS